MTELYDKLQNPFTGRLQQQAETEEQLKQDNNILKVKLDTCLRLLRHQNVVFRTAAGNGESAEDALKQFQALAPDAETILRAIVETSASTSQIETEEACMETAEDEHASKRMRV